MSTDQRPCPPPPSPGVRRFKPPRIFLLCLAGGALLEWLWPWSPGLALGPWPGLALALAGFLFMMWGHQRFQRLGVEVKTCRPARALVDSAAYRFSRNPMYVGMLAILAGLGLASDSVWLLLAAAAMTLYLGLYMVPREERYLAAAFGAEYADYCRRVRRWL